MPLPLSVLQLLDAVTGPFASIRLPGNREAVDALTPRLDHIVIDRGEEVRDDVEAIQLLAKRVPVVAFVNNHFAGFAPETLRRVCVIVDALERLAGRLAFPTFRIGHVPPQANMSVCAL
jgi:hypothetical protein